ncbi:MAG TPA: RNA polymerase subunit sigma-24 [Desulfotomaculum sp.]|nr:MAG: RNA polymerase subunit sigma-24 [Desulfotomaculum sp. BICA1-6]HBX23491.1 RNA polymerase subunit sigma-24 [Desulfotomaculum sp.]
MDSDTRLLVEKSQHGDTAAFGQLVEIYQNRVYALCYQLTNSHYDAQDLAQEAFVRAYKSMHGFRKEADFGTWLHRITVNQWINIKRRRKNEISLDANIKTNDGGELTMEVASDNETPEEAVERWEFNSLVKTAFKELSQEHRTVLVLREMQGYNYDEIAGIMNCSLGTVKSRINRARQQLKEKITLQARAGSINLPYGNRN